MKIAMICMHSSPVGELGTRDTGGMSVYVRETARRLAGIGHAVDIFTGVRHPAGAKVVQPFPNVRIVCLHTGLPQPFPHAFPRSRLAQFFKELDRFRIAEGIQYDLVHSHYYASGQIGLWARESWGVPHVFMFHTLGALKNLFSGSEREPEGRIAVEKQLAAECDLILAATEREKRHVIELYGAPPRRIQVVRCGVDLEKFRPSESFRFRAGLGLNGAGPVILYVGRFDPIKGIDRLLAAAARLRREMELRVLLIGGGGESAPEVQALHSLCSDLSLHDCVAFAGRKPHDALPDYYSAADVLVLPSHYESFGLVVLEALACGTPVVATKVGVVEDIVRNGLNGWVVPENSPESLAVGIRRALELRSGPGTNVNAESIRATARDYDWDLVARAVESEYLRLCGVKEDESERARGCSCCGFPSRRR